MSNSHTFDAIVVGSGITGGWAAKELTEQGLETLMLERGRPVEHMSGYPTAMWAPWEAPHRGKVSQEVLARKPIQFSSGAMRETNQHFFVDDLDNPYSSAEEKPFAWIRGYQTGGRSLTWGRQSYRWSEMDFTANAKDGMGIDWPIRYADLAPWYEYVEEYAGISGQAEGLSQLPDSKFLPPMELSCVERHLQTSISKYFPGRTLTIGRTANLSQPHRHRSACMYRDRCSRGCPYGAYFSTQSVTLPAAMATGKLTLQNHAIVHSLIYDDAKQRATGVRVIDAETGKTTEYFAKVIFLCASTLGSTFILLHSVSDRFPSGLGNDSDALGRYLMDHHFQIGAYGVFDGFEDQHHYGRRPNGIYIPRFRNLDKGSRHPDFLRGYGFQGAGGRDQWWRGNTQAAFGAALKQELQRPGPWKMSLSGFGECLPYADNRVSLNTDKVDKWGLPTLQIDSQFRENERAMRQDMRETAAEMLEAAGAQHIGTFEQPPIPGMAIHEMGTARMGRDPKTSVLNGYNQVHTAPNVFVTDGACMTSSACQNPSLTYMALTARAAHYAVGALKRQEL